MATPQLSPGVLIREVDLTVGRADNVLDNVGAIAGPFAIGPVDYPVDISTEQELINVFGKPYNQDGHYEYWMSASSYLSYGGVLKVVRCSGDDLVNANAKREVDTDIISLSSVSYLGIPNSGVGTTARSAGTYSVTLGAGCTTSGSGTDVELSVLVSGVDGSASVTIVEPGDGFGEGDLITISNTNLGAVGFGTTGSIQVQVNAVSFVLGDNVVGDTTLLIKNPDDYEYNHSDTEPNYMFASKNPGTWANGLKVCVIDDKADQIINIGGLINSVRVGYALTTPIVNQISAGVGATSKFNGYLKSIITGVDATTNTVDVKICSLVDDEGIEYPVTYAQGSVLRSFRRNTTVGVSSATQIGIGTTQLANTDNAVLDWYDQQTIELTNTTFFWKSIAPKPITNEYTAERGGANDALHVVVIDDNGSITGIQGNILEKHLGISKALDTISRVNSPQKIWYKNYLSEASTNIYAGYNPSSDSATSEPVYQTGFSSGFTPYQNSDSLWNQEAQGVTFSAIGNLTYTLVGGKNYTVVDGYSTELGDIFNSYSLFSNRDEIRVDYLIMGPGFSSKSESQAKANHLISIAEQRRDCIAVISPHRDDVIDVPNSNDQTNNVIQFFSSLSPSGDVGGVRSSSYAVFDSGYKYTYDRFNNRFRYIPCNADVAGLMVRTSILAYPWFSPAGQQRGVLNNAIKLAYNPDKAQRDRLYPERINAIINQPGVGVMLYGDKTALGYASAFDRINVRRLFLTVEQALERTAQAQLFELNDEITRANFINIVEPYLRDVQAKRGVYDFLVVCDDTNNTPDVIDNNEFRADIYLKPTKSINYVTLTFVATRTGISFEEVAGRA